MNALQQKFVLARTTMQTALIERDVEVDVVLTALVCNENPLLVGPPGTAKSFLIDSLLDFLGKGSRKFSVLFTRFTTPEEIFGPISVKGLTEDVYRRVSTGKLQEAHLAFGDEIFKASTAILGTLLKALNERTIEVGDGSVKRIPLLQFLAASNEFPQDVELGALFDRFLLRRKVRPIVTQEGHQRLLKGGLNQSTLKPKLEGLVISPEEVKQARAASRDIDYTPEAWNGLFQIITELQKEGIVPGDRRKLKAVGAVQAYAYICGADEVEMEHLEILSTILWDEPSEQPEKCEKIVGQIANPTDMLVNSCLARAESAFNNTADKYEGIALKLDAIQKELKGLKKDPRVDRALSHIAALRKQNFNRITGVHLENDE